MQPHLPRRREADTCSICWFPANPATDFAVSGPGMMGIADDALCCGYGFSGFDDRGYDCLLIPMASNTRKAMVKANRFCGASKGLASVGSQLGVGTTANAELDITICCELLDLLWCRTIHPSFTSTQLRSSEISPLPNPICFGFLRVRRRG